MSPLEKLGVTINEWPQEVRAAWDAAKNEEERKEAEIQVLRRLLRECADLSENWPNIAHTQDLAERIEAALTPNV